MAGRKQFLNVAPPDPELAKLLDRARHTTVSEADLHEQRVSVAFGNAPTDAKHITKDSVRGASTRIRLGVTIERGIGR